jgi:hypothetical protein
MLIAGQFHLLGPPLARAAGARRTPGTPALPRMHDGSWPSGLAGAGVLRVNRGNNRRILEATSVFGSHAGRPTRLQF